MASILVWPRVRKRARASSVMKSPTKSAKHRFFIKWSARVVFPVLLLPVSAILIVSGWSQLLPVVILKLGKSASVFAKSVQE